MQLRDLIAKFPRSSVNGSLDGTVTGLAYDSRKVKKGDLFFAIPGNETDGAQFATKALAAGAIGVISETPLPSETPTSLHVQVPNVREAMSLASHLFYHAPSEEIPLVGITGTNGKTTTAFLTHHLISSSWHRAGLMGTTGYDLGGETQPASHTTPESVDVHHLLRQMADNDCRAAVMETSSHGLHQNRVAHVNFRVGVFTNLSQDHFDYHGNFENYFAAKRILAEQLVNQTAVNDQPPTLVTNLDDKYGARLAEEFKERGINVLTYGMSVAADLRAGDIKQQNGQLQFPLTYRGRTALVRLPYVGRFNVYNALAAIGAALGLNLNFRETIEHLAAAPQVPGRMECVSGNHPIRVYVDYAHTPDALHKALECLRELKPTRLFTIFGCGGNRDRSKRALMAEAAAEHSHAVVVTNDNPRDEDPQRIIDDILRGLGKCPHTVIQDRAEAIEKSIRAAIPGEIILIAGKGHEDYQIVGPERRYFSDQKVAQQAIRDIPTFDQSDHSDQY